ncbi:MAG: butyrate kinase [Clostridia bacterium]
MERILVINPGSTSTKVAVFDDVNRVFYENIKHDDAELNNFSWVMDQKDFRTEKILSCLNKNGFDINAFTCIMSRGGMIPPCASGAYRINEAMLFYMYNQKVDTHISNVGCAIAYDIAGRIGVGAYIYDPVTVDELAPIARITGLPELPKLSRGHALNTHAMAFRCAKEIMRKPIKECTFIVQHLGGGTSVWLIDKGKSIDMYSDDDAGFAPERCGKLQAMNLIKLCYSGKYTISEMSKKVRGNAGLRAHLGTSDAIEVERMIDNGDEKALLIYKAFAYGVAKGIGDLATVVNGKVDRIILTGGVANSKMLTDWITERVSFIAPVEIMAGEYEMEALAEGGMRILKGEETAHEFSL